MENQPRYQVLEKYRNHDGRVLISQHTFRDLESAIECYDEAKAEETNIEVLIREVTEWEQQPPREFMAGTDEGK